ncbi:MAG: glutamate 5-kinase [Pseudomonadota bacterium]
MRIYQDAHRWVIKIGSSIVTNDGQGVNSDAIESWAKQLAALRAQNRKIVLVSSGAVAEGMFRLGWNRRPTDLPHLQAAAAIGQMGLIQTYESAFRKHNLKTAQLLLTHEDFSDRQRYLNIKATLTTLLELGIIPIINENDSVATEEIRFGDNDTLSAMVANLIEADILAILTDQTGVYTADPRKHPDAMLIPEAVAGDMTLELLAGGAGTQYGTGGMITKILAAKRAARSGTHTLIASGHETNLLLRLIEGEAIGTLLKAPNLSLNARRQWLADQIQLGGKLHIDDGAAHALLTQGKSLLSIGIVNCEGDFLRGDIVGCYNALGIEIARGMVNYPSHDLRRIIRHPSVEIPLILGYAHEPEVIHRDNLVIVAVPHK